MVTFVHESNHLPHSQSILFRESTLLPRAESLVFSMETWNEETQDGEPAMHNNSTSTISTLENIDVNAGLHGGEQPQLQHSISEYIVKAYRVCKHELATYGRPGLKRDLASWTGATLIGTSLMMYVHALFIPFA